MVCLGRVLDGGLCIVLFGIGFCRGMIVCLLVMNGLVCCLGLD